MLWYFDLEDPKFTQEDSMETETSQSNIAAKLPKLKLNDYEMWRLMIEQFFLVQDYALWEIIMFGNSFKPGTTS